jgi:hypothetical protein
VGLFAPQTKAVADETISLQPTVFLRQLQKAMHSSTTQPLSVSDRLVSRTFDHVFASATQAAQRGNYQPLSEIVNAAHTAHAMILDRWRSHLGPTQWVYFGNMGEWGSAYLDRDASNEYIQYGNDATAARYYDAFTDHNGTPLDGSVFGAYRLKFDANQIPQAQRFWSLTAYIPPGVTLVPNSDNKYVVGSYTPGLHRDRDGSITIYIQPDPPPLPLRPNWLPVPSGPFSLLLRVYGPAGNTANGTYVPPEIKR